MAKKVMQKELESCKNLTLAKHCVTVHSALNEESTQEIRALADELCAEYQNAESRGGTDFAALDKIGYGLYVVTTRDGGRDNGLILNTVTQLTDSPKKIGVTVNRENYSHHIISRTKKLNVCCLTTDAPFKVFEVFGFASGRDTDKFADCTPQRSENGLVVLPRYLNAYFSLEVEDEVDLGTHTMFICHITEARTLSDKPSMTYAYYHEHVKPRPNATSGWVCKICGYVHEAQDLPADFICPLCKHGVDAFEKIQ
jgi:flavin reductase (DIM6/NTAB) family NADH-FMN oxidoreductase RutF